MLEPSTKGFVSFGAFVPLVDYVGSWAFIARSGNAVRGRGGISSINARFWPISACGDGKQSARSGCPDISTNQALSACNANAVAPTVLGLIERSVGAIEPALRVGLAGMGSEPQAERVRNDLAFEFGRRRLEGFTQVIGHAFSAFAINTLKDQDELLSTETADDISLARVGA
jgi:hypothetical protein